MYSGVLPFVIFSTLLLMHVSRAEIDLLYPRQLFAVTGESFPYPGVALTDTVLIVCDGGNHRIVAVNPGTRQTITLAGVKGLFGDSVGPALTARFSLPSGVAPLFKWSSRANRSLLYGVIIADTLNDKLKLLHFGSLPGDVWGSNATVSMLRPAAYPRFLHVHYGADHYTATLFVTETRLHCITVQNISIIAATAALPADNRALQWIGNCSTRATGGDAVGSFAQSRFNEPNAAVVSPDGLMLFIADPPNDRIYGGGNPFNRTRAFTSDLPATEVSAGLTQPQDVVLAPAVNAAQVGTTLYVAHFALNEITSFRVRAGFSDAAATVVSDIVVQPVAKFAVSTPVGMTILPNRSLAITTSNLAPGAALVLQCCAESTEADWRAVTDAQFVWTFRDSINGIDASPNSEPATPPPWWIGSYPPALNVSGRGDLDANDAARRAVTIAIPVGAALVVVSVVMYVIWERVRWRRSMRQRTLSDVVEMEGTVAVDDQQMDMTPRRGQLLDLYKPTPPPPPRVADGDVHRNGSDDSGGSLRTHPAVPPKKERSHVATADRGVALPQAKVSQPPPPTSTPPPTPPPQQVQSREMPPSARVSDAVEREWSSEEHFSRSGSQSDFMTAPRDNNNVECDEDEDLR